MKISIFRSLLFFPLTVGLAFAQARSLSVSSLGLPRLDQVAQSKSSSDNLSAQGALGARNVEKRGAKFLALDASTEWSRPLRGGTEDLVFVSFSVYGSLGTIVEVGGARLGIIESDIGDYAQLAADENSKWRLLGIHVPLQKFEGKPLGSFSVLTVRLDRTDGSWDLYQSARLVAEDLPLDASIKHGQFRVRAGADGAMVNGLVQSDENPLYADTNGNGVDDAFEQLKQGRLLTATDSKATRKQLIVDWRKHQRTAPPPALFVNLPRPD